MIKVNKNLIVPFLLIVNFLSFYAEVEAQTIEREIVSGPVFAGQMLHTWISWIILLLSITIIFILVRFVRDSELGKPIILFTLAALFDVFVGIMRPLETNVEFMWLVFAVVNIFILLALIWIAQLLGIFALIKNKIKRKK